MFPWEMEVSYLNQLNFHASYYITLNFICTRYTKNIKSVHIEYKPLLILTSISLSLAIFESIHTAMI